MNVCFQQQVEILHMSSSIPSDTFKLHHLSVAENHSPISLFFAVRACQVQSQIKNILI